MKKLHYLWIVPLVFILELGLILALLQPAIYPYPWEDVVPLTEVLLFFDLVIAVVLGIYFSIHPKRKRILLSPFPVAMPKLKELKDEVSDKKLYSVYRTSHRSMLRVQAGWPRIGSIDSHGQLIVVRATSAWEALTKVIKDSEFRNEQ